MKRLLACLARYLAGKVGLSVLSTPTILATKEMKEEEQRRYNHEHGLVSDLG